MEVWSNKMNREDFQDMSVSLPLYGCTPSTLKKHLDKNVFFKSHKYAETIKSKKQHFGDTEHA